MTNPTPTIHSQRARSTRQPTTNAQTPAQHENQYQQLLDQLRLLGFGPQGPLRTVGLTSSNRREGVTTVGCNLALQTASSMGWRVLLIDANFPNPRLQRVFRIPISPGLTDLLNGTAEESDCFHDLSTRSAKSWASAFKHSLRRRRGIFRYLTKTRQPTSSLPLTILPAGNDTAQVASFLDAEMDGLLAHAAADFDLVIVDLPDATSAVGYPFLQTLDGVMLVLEAESTSDTVAQKAVNRLNQNGVNVLGVVFNKYRSHLPRWIDRRLGG